MMRLLASVVLAFSLVGPAVSKAQVVIQLNDAFIEKYKNRVLIDANLTVDHSHKAPKKPMPSKPSNDGDIHVAGRSSTIGLPIVAELMNAKDALPQVEVFSAAAGTTDKVDIEGAWRLWCEHGGATDQIQGKAWPKAKHTNPDHCFEIHPVTAVDGVDVRHTWKGIDDYRYKDAEDAFSRYEQVKAELFHDPAKKRTTIDTAALGYNYVEFVVGLDEDPTGLVDDGLFVRGSACTVDGELLTTNRRMVFAKGTEPYSRVVNLKAGAAMRVVGMPRINLSNISWRVKAGPSRPEVLRWNLPYEMVIVAVLESDGTEECGEGSPDPTVLMPFWGVN